MSLVSLGQLGYQDCARQLLVRFTILLSQRPLQFAVLQGEQLNGM